MKQEYKEMQEKMLPSEEKREEMWERIVKESAENRKQKPGRYLKTGLIGSVAAALLACVLFLPQIGLADRVKYIQSIFANGSDVSKDIQEDIYVDQDQHVKMQVKEALSDGSSIFLGICYTALDQEGKEWLSQLKDYAQWNEWDDYIMTAVPSEDEIEYSIGWGQNWDEQEELATENERHFIFSYFGNEDVPLSVKSKQTFRYSMSEGFREFQIARKANLDKMLYRIKKEKSSKDEEGPLYLRISKLSFQFLLQNNMRDPKKIVFLMKDGSRRYGSMDSMYSPKKTSELMKLVEKEEGNYSILSGSFVDQDAPEEVLPWTTINDPKQIAAVEIDGKRYDLVLEK